VFLDSSVFLLFIRLITWCSCQCTECLTSPRGLWLVYCLNCIVHCIILEIEWWWWCKVSYRCLITEYGPVHITCFDITFNWRTRSFFHAHHSGQIAVVASLPAERRIRPLDNFVWICWSTLRSRAHSFLRAAEFRAEPRNSAVAAEFPCFRGISRNSA